MFAASIGYGRALCSVWIPVRKDENVNVEQYTNSTTSYTCMAEIDNRNERGIKLDGNTEQERHVYDNAMRMYECKPVPLFCV